MLRHALLLFAILVAVSSGLQQADTVVPEEHPSQSIHLHPLALIATDAINTELANLKKSAPSDEGVAKIEAMIQDMNKGLADPASSQSCLAKNTADEATCSAKTTKTDCEGVVDTAGNKKCTYQSDGGTQDMEGLLTTAKTTINAAVNTMLSGLVTAYNNAKTDLQALDAAIDNSKRTISSADLETIKTKATTWCEKKRALESATSNATTADSTLTTKLNAAFDLTDILVKEVAGIGPSDCSKENGNARGSTCPTASCNLAARITSKVETARAEYLEASWDKADKDALKNTATTQESNRKGEFQDSVTTTASTYHSMCDSNDQVHGTAVNLFNSNNDGRASMYRSLGIIQCHINHMKSGETFDVATSLLKSGEAATSTDATNCVGKLKSTATIKADLFPVASSTEDSSKSCPLLSAYEDDIRNYGSLGFDKDDADWSPTTTNCDAVIAHVVPGTSGSAPVTPSPLVGTAVLFDTGADYDRSVAGKLTRNTPTSSDNGVACSNELINSGLPGVKFTCPNHDASFVGFVDASATPTKSSDLTWAAFCQTPRYWIREWDSAQSAQWLKDWCTTTEVSCENDETFKFTTSTVFEVRVNSANQVEYAVHVGSNVVLLHTSTLAVTTPIKMCAQIYYNDRPVTNIQWLDAL